MVATSSSDNPGHRKLQKARQRIVTKVLPSIYRQYTPEWLGGSLVVDLKVPMEYYPARISGVSTRNRIDGELAQVSSIKDAYEVSGGTLLVLGDAGFGKTHALVEVMLECLRQCKKTKDAPIPFYIDLGGWDSRQEDFMEWCTSHISSQYGIDKGLVATWMRDDDLALMCDGLDQLDRKNRTRCIAVINKFISNHGMISIIIASRDREYFEVKKRLDVRGRVQLKLLPGDSILAELSKIDSGQQGLAEKARQDHKLRELLRVPLFLNLAAAVYRDAPSSSIVRRENSWAQSIVSSYLDHAKERELSRNRLADLGLQTWLPRLALYMKNTHQVACYPDRIPYELVEEHAKPEVARSSARVACILVSLLILSVRIPALVMFRHNSAFGGFVAGTVIILPGEWLATKKLCGEVPRGPGRMKFDHDLSGILKNVIIWCVFYNFLGSAANILNSIKFYGPTTILFMGVCTAAAFYPFHVIAKHITEDGERLPSYPGEEVRSLLFFSLTCAGSTAVSLYLTLFMTESPLMRSMLQISLPGAAFLSLYFILPLVLMVWLYSGGKRLVYGFFAYRNLVDLELVPRKYWSSFRALRQSSILIPFAGGYAVSHSLVRDHLAARAGHSRSPLRTRQY